ncbi:hypothetical protein MNBD_GAMMA25-1720 [hydrothermal vent metagenome]|uniref:Response regulatory domain-containing protein n=1 Tax=hydrothermal vent metagenome TaxID=652676 RepID=A0A3B1BIN0_9ZZZZ
MDRILIVDDEELNRDFLVHLLNDEFETMVAGDGEQALKTAVDNVPDLILLDIQMPVDDELTYGKYKDYLARLTEGVEGRVAAMIAETMIHKRTEQIKSVFENMLSAVSGIQEQNYKLRSGSATIIEQMREDIQMIVSEISVSDDLSEESENRILNITDGCLKQNNILFDKGLKFNEHVAMMIKVFEHILQKDVLTETDFEKLVGSLALLEAG